MNAKHIPVLKNEVLEFIENPKLVVDCNLGLGGHSKEILKKFDDCKLIGIEKDLENLEIAKKNLKKFRERTKIFNGNFSEIKKFIHEASFGNPDVILFDLGLSSPHLESSNRGFSFKKDEYLDMRFNKNETEITAEKILNHESEQGLIEIFQNYGEVKKTYTLCRKIVEKRKEKKIKTTFDLTDILFILFKHNKTEFSKVFQALRIAVNKELSELEKGLENAFQILEKNGLIICISYHSLEDRIVKTFFRQKAKKCICEPEVLMCNCNKKQEIKILTKKVIRPKIMEVRDNPRSRSAKLRAAKKIA